MDKKDKKRPRGRVAGSPKVVASPTSSKPTRVTSTSTSSHTPRDESKVVVGGVRRSGRSRSSSADGVRATISEIDAREYIDGDHDDEVGLDSRDDVSSPAAAKDNTLSLTSVSSSLTSSSSTPNVLSAPLAAGSSSSSDSGAPSTVPSSSGSSRAGLTTTATRLSDDAVMAFASVLGQNRPVPRSATSSSSSSMRAAHRVTPSTVPVQATALSANNSHVRSYRVSHDRAESESDSDNGSDSDTRDDSGDTSDDNGGDALKWERIDIPFRDRVGLQAQEQVELTYGSHRAEVTAKPLKDSRNKHEMIHYAIIADAAAAGRNDIVLEIAARRMWGIRHADSTGSWSFAKALEVVPVDGYGSGKLYHRLIKRANELEKQAKQVSSAGRRHRDGARSSHRRSKHSGHGSSGGAVSGSSGSNKDGASKKGKKPS